MTQAEKINHVGQIIDRAYRVLYNYIPKKEEDKFYYINNDTDAQEFFANTSIFSTELGERLFQCYKVCNQYAEIELELQNVIMYGRVDGIYYNDDFYHNAIEQGILFVKEFIERDFKESPCKEKAIYLIDREIELLNQNADIILSLDPTLAIEKSHFDEFEFFSGLENTLPIEVLAPYVLNKIEFGANGKCFDLQDNTIDLLFKAFYFDIRDVVEYSKYTEQEKKIILNDFGRLSQFIFEEEHSSSGFVLLALIYHKLNRVISDFDDYITVMTFWWMFGTKYEEMVNENAWLTDWFVMEKVFGHVISIIDRLEQENKLDIHNLQTYQIYGIRARSTMHLAKIYPALYEPRKGVDLCISSLEKINNSSSGDEIQAFDLIFAILKSLIEVNIDDAVIFAFDVLGNKASFLRTKDIDDQKNEFIRKGIEIFLFEMLLEKKDKELIITLKKNKTQANNTPLLDGMFSCLEDFENDIINGENLTLLQNTIAEYNSDYGFGSDDESKAKTLVFKLKNQSNIEELRKNIEELDKLLRKDAEGKL
jgi:hypothetical protein